MSLKAIWVDYCENGSIHGLRHVIQKDIKLWERFMWILLLVVASIAILVLVSASWEQYSYSTMEIIVDDPHYPLTKVDYPAVTICPISKIMYSKALKFVLNNFSHDSDLRTRWSTSLQALGRMQFPHNTQLHFFVQNKSTVNIPLEDISNLMHKLAPTIEDVFDKCYWRGSMYNCSDILRYQRTEEGFCFSFNSKTAERSKNDNNEMNPPFVGPNGNLIPIRNNAAGKGTGLKVVMNNMSDEFFPNDRRRRGFNVMVHTPDVLPDVSTGYKVHVALDRISRISVSVAQVLADKSLDRLSEQDQQCFMYHQDSDSTTTDYKAHDEDTCYSKCRLRTVYEVCNCTQYFFQLYKGLGTHCGIQHIRCLIINDVRQRNPRAPENEPGFPEWSIPVSMNCSCKPPCSYISYTTELQLHSDRQFTNRPLTSRYKVVLEVNYRELFATSYQRSMKYTTQDLLVSFGGVASLFLGCSLVSIVEILYVIYKSFWVIAVKKHRDTFDSDASDSETWSQYPFAN